MKRKHAVPLGIALALFTLPLLHPALALAQDLGTPASSVDALLKGQLAQQWFSTLQGMARDLYIGLFTIELIVVGVQGLLHKDNIAEFFQTFVFKVVMATAMIAVIGNAGNIFPTVVSLFKQTATQTINDTCSGPKAPQNCQTVGDSNPSGLESTFLGWAAAYFLAADVSRAADSAESSAAGIVVFGTGLPGLSSAFLLGHENFELFCMALGMLCVVAAGGVLLTYLLLTFECQIIMMIGVFFLAFQGSRFTAQFAQGYMSYCVNIGVKFFVYFFIIAILKVVTSDGDGSLAGFLGGLAAGAAIPFGAGSIALVAASSPIPIISVISSILVAAIPNFAGSLLSGSSALSAGAAMGQLTNALATGSGMNSALQKNAAADHTSRDSGHAKEELHGKSQASDGGQGGQGGQRHAADTPKPAQSVHIGPPPHGAAELPPSTGTGAQKEGTWHVNGSLTAGDSGPSNGAHSNAPLKEYSPEEIGRMKPTELYDVASASDWGDLSDAQKSAVISDPALRKAAYDAYSRKGDEAERTRKSQGGLFLSSLKGVAPQGEQPPSAVQVRVTNPDKL